MNQKETALIQSALSDARRALAWLKSDRVELCGVQRETPGRAAITTAYVNRDGTRSLHPINRDYGSELQILENAIQTLQSTINTRGFEQLKQIPAANLSPTA